MNKLELTNEDHAAIRLALSCRMTELDDRLRARREIQAVSPTVTTAETIIMLEKQRAEMDAAFTKLCRYVPREAAQ